MTVRLLVLMTIPTNAMASWYQDATTEVYFAGDSIEGEEIVAPEGPTLEDCQDLDWLNLTATADEQTACAALLEDEMQARIDEADLDGTLRFGSRVFENSIGMPQELNVTRGPIAEEREHRASYYDPTGIQAKESSYEADGDWITSCDEYAYQRFYQYSLFQQLSRSVDDRYRAIMDNAFDGSRISAGAVGIEGTLGYDFETRDGVVFADDQFGPGPWEEDAHDPSVQVRPKNTFFALTDDEIDAIELIDVQMADTLRKGQQYWRTSDRPMTQYTAPTLSGAVNIENRWRFHEVQSERLAGSSDAMLAYYREKRADFARVVEHRRRLLSDGVSPLDVGDWAYVQNLDETVTGIDMELYKMLLEADSLGCLSIATTESDRVAGIYDFHACDWAPQDFHEEVIIEAESMKKGAIESCEATADFAALASTGSYEWYDTNGTLHAEPDPRVAASDFRLYLERMAESRRNYVENQISTYDVQSQGIPWNSYQWSGGETYGDTDYFAASWNAAVGWHIFDTAGGEVCDVNPYFKASGDFNAHIFGGKAEVLDALVDFHVRRDRRIVDFEVLGFDLIQESWESKGLTYDRRIDYSYVYDKTWEEKKIFAQGSTTFTVWVIPFTVQGGVSGRVGINYGFDARITEKTRDVYDANGNLVPDECWELYGKAGAYARPYAALDGKASMGIGIPGLSAGVYGRLTLLMVSVPTRVEVAATALPDLSDIAIELGVTSELEVETLSGEIGLYADIFFNRHEHELYRWRGLRYTHPLLETEYDIELQVWGGVCTLPGIDCAG